MALVAKRIMVGYDGSRAARDAVDRAAELAGYGSSVVVVHVARRLLTRTIGKGPGSVGWEAGSGLLSEALERLARRQVTARAIVRVGDVADELVEVAKEEGADLLIVGRRNGGKPARLVLGSVSRRVIDEAPCDVLVVH